MNLVELFLQSLKYDISSEEELRVFLKLNINNIIKLIEGRQQKCIFKYIDNFNKNKIFKCNYFINLYCIKFNRKLGYFEKIYLYINNIEDIPRDEFNQEKIFNNLSFSYKSNIKINLQNWIKLNKQNQSNYLGFDYTISELKFLLINKNLVFYKGDLLYSSPFLFGSFYIKESMIPYRYSLWKYTQFLDINVEVNERIFCLFNNIKSYPICLSCGKEIKNFIGLQEGYRMFCSRKCQTSNVDIINKRKETNFKNHGGEWFCAKIQKSGNFDKDSSYKKKSKTMGNWSEEKKAEYSLNMSKSLSNMSEETKLRKKFKNLETKKKNNTLKGHGGQGFDKKAQDIFWFLDDNLKDYNPIYATYKNRDINGKRNDEYFIPVWDVSKTHQIRKLDFYLKLNNDFIINIEYDNYYHKKEIDKDLIREQEILQVVPNIIILRVREKDYFEDGDKIKKDLLDIILNVENSNYFDYNKINNKYLPLHILIKEKETMCI